MLQQQVKTELSICLTDVIMHIKLGINIVGNVIPILPQILCIRLQRKVCWEEVNDEIYCQLQTIYNGLKGL